MPVGMHSAQLVVMEGKVYLGGGGIGSKGYAVVVYDPQRQTWSKLPKYENRGFRMAVINNQLTLIGGAAQGQKQSNKIGVWNQKINCWTTPYLPMPTARWRSSVITYDKWLVVAGGHTNRESVDTVEILDTSTNHWYSAPPLPQHCGSMTSALLGDTWYLLGGSQYGPKPIKDMFSVSLPILISQATQPPKKSATPKPHSPWQKLADPPLVYSCGFAFHGSLLAAGGRDDHGKPSSAIHLYQPASNDWVKAGNLPIAVYECTSTVLPTGEFIILGGSDTNNPYALPSMQVYMATL